MARTTRLRELVARRELDFLMEAHDGLSARIAQEAGFSGLWASGLSIAAMLGLRDCNEATYTEVLQIVEYMADATDIPILMDGDSGFGNFNTVRRLVRKLESRGIAGVCLEDKRFPKSNSFVDRSQQLVSIEEFSGKIQAAKDSQDDPDFVVVARCEAFISGLGLDEALRRSEAYRRAGADALMIHSSKADADEILAFMREWAGRLPVVIAPTKYYRTPTQAFREAGISVAIWANHLMRSALSAMQRTARQLFAEETLVGIEPDIAPLSEVFRLQNEAELTEAEARYLPTEAPRVPAAFPVQSRV
jgi:phosphoenolpyruvate phosphomutase